MAFNCEYEKVFIAIIFEIVINMDMNNEYNYQTVIQKFSQPNHKLMYHFAEIIQTINLYNHDIVNIGSIRNAFHSKTEEKT